MEIISAFIQHCKVENVKINPPASVEDIKRTEEAISFTFPPDFKAFYLLVDGFENWDMLPSLISIWPLQRIVDEYTELAKSENANFVGFCDYLINCHSIGFFKNQTGVYKSYDEFNPIAQSFTEALQLINKNSDEIC